MKRAVHAFRDWLVLRSTIGAIALLVLGILFVTIEAQSPNWVYFTGDHVTGTVQEGLVYYRVDGRDYTQDDTRNPTGADGSKVSVYFFHDAPEDGRIDQPTRWIEGATMVLWFAAAVLLVSVSAVRRSRRSQHSPK